MKFGIESNYNIFLKEKQYEKKCDQEVVSKNKKCVSLLVSRLLCLPCSCGLILCGDRSKQVILIILNACRSYIYILPK